jgi:hypothetical protein
LNVLIRSALAAVKKLETVFHTNKEPEMAKHSDPLTTDQLLPQTQCGPEAQVTSPEENCLPATTASVVEVEPLPAQPADQGIPKPAVSERKRAANRSNAQKSTGPKSARGKASSRRNATTHGWLARIAMFCSDRWPSAVSEADDMTIPETGPSKEDEDSAGAIVIH